MAPPARSEARARSARPVGRGHHRPRGRRERRGRRFRHVGRGWIVALRVRRRRGRARVRSVVPRRVRCRAARRSSAARLARRRDRSPDGDVHGPRRCLVRRRDAGARRALGQHVRRAASARAGRALGRGVPRLDDRHRASPKTRSRRARGARSPRGRNALARARARRGARRRRVSRRRADRISGSGPIVGRARRTPRTARADVPTSS